jgi:formylglycine-generating enzyme required for sulfatase activity
MVHLQTPGAAGSVADFHIDPYEFPSQPGVKPKVYTNATTAREACAAAGKRLCTAAEWRRACAGPDGASRFGYGAQYEAGRCHVARALGSGQQGRVHPHARLHPVGQRQFPSGRDARERAHRGAHERQDHARL